MRLLDYLKPERVVLLNGRTKCEVLSELVALLADTGVGVCSEELARVVWKREEMMSTGIGNALAIPHVRMPELKATAMAVGVSRDGVADYASLDNQPVHIILLIAAPVGQHETYIRLLALAAEVLRHEKLRDAIANVSEPGEAYRIFAEAQP